MEKFKIEKIPERISSINRTIRFAPELFDKLMELSEEKNASFNRLVNQCVRYALDNLEDSPQDIE